MKKLLFSITNLEIGGAEKVLVSLVNELKNKYDITVLTLYGEGSLLEKVNDSVKVKSVFSKPYEKLNFFTKKMIGLFIKIPFLRKKIFFKYATGYDVVISFLEGPITEILQDIPCKKIAWIHTDLSKHYGKKKYKSLINMYNKYDSLVFVSEISMDGFLSIDKENKCFSNKTVIHNFVDANYIKKQSLEKMDVVYSDSKNFVVVARLVKPKGIDRLMKVHKRLIDEGLIHHIYVVGDGPLRDSLNDLLNYYDISSTFHLLGARSNPYPYILKADYFLLPSYYEGYPVSVIEAEILNKFILVTDTACKEVIKNYPNKMIFSNDEDGIYKGMKTIMKRKDSLVKPYIVKDNDEILKQISDLIEEE